MVTNDPKLGKRLCEWDPAADTKEGFGSVWHFSKMENWEIQAGVLPHIQAWLHRMGHSKASIMTMGRPDHTSAPLENHQGQHQ
jgi:hypothetical protein